MNAIEVRGLEKSFKGTRKGLREVLAFWRRPKAVQALRGVDLSVASGELVTLLGPNGAGKTTLLKVLATLVAPTAGTVRVLGDDVAGKPQLARQRIGYVLADERSFYWRLTCRDNLRFFAALQGISGRDAKARIMELAALVGLVDHLDRVFADLSTGQRQRMAIARGLLADPPVLLFDEATRSLDPGRAARLRRVIRELLVGRAGKAVLFATHDLHEAKEISDRVVLMQEGKVACEGGYAEVEAHVLEVFSKEADEEEAELARILGGPPP